MFQKLKGGEPLSELHFDGNRLAKLMNEQGWSDLRLAREVGVSRQMIYHLKRGTRKTASAEIIKKIADVLCTTVPYLLGQAEEEETTATLREIMRVAKTMPGARQEEVLRIILTLQKLDSEQVSRPLPDAAMVTLIKIAEILRANPDNGDVLQLLRDLLRNSGRWMIDLGDKGPDDPGNDG